MTFVPATPQLGAGVWKQRGWRPSASAASGAAEQRAEEVWCEFDGEWVVRRILARRISLDAIHIADH